MIDALTGIAGLVLVGVALWDVFETIVVPRPTPGWLRIGRYVIRWTWRPYRNIVVRFKTGLARDSLLGLYAPGAAILLLAVWLAFIVVGYGLILFALRADLNPTPQTLGDAIYFAGSSILTIGFGDIVATSGIARLVVVIGAATGLGIVALVITFLFSLFGSYQRREVAVVTLSARAKAPPSAMLLLLTYARLDLVDELPALFREWEVWTAEVLDTHVSYPLLGYFRSSHDNVSWISSLGAVLDAASLVLTTVTNVPRGHAKITHRIGTHLVEDITNILGLKGDGSAVDRDEFAVVYAKLGKVGYELEPEDDAWHAFERERSSYAGRLLAMADYWATPAPVWVSRPSMGESLAHIRPSETPSDDGAPVTAVATTADAKGARTPG
jgi:hypothetical protein